MTLSKKSNIALTLSQVCYVLLMLLMIIGSLPGNLSDGPSLWLVLSVKLLPLLIVLPGLWLDKLRSHIWLCFIVLFYFTRAVVDAFLSEGATLDLFISIITVVLFLASMYYVKWERALGRSL